MQSAALPTRAGAAATLIGIRNKQMSDRTPAYGEMSDRTSSDDGHDQMAIAGRGGVWLSRLDVGAGRCPNSRRGALRAQLQGFFVANKPG